MATLRRSRVCWPGFSYAELLIVVAVFGVLAGLAASAVSLKPSEAELAARTFAADVMYAQAEAVGRPDLGCVIKLNPSASTYWLARPTSPDAPLTNSITKKAYQVQFGAGSESGLRNVTIGTYSFGGDAVLAFDTFGALDQSTDATIALQAGGETYTVTISAATGVATVSRTTTSMVVSGGGGAIELF